MKTDLPRRDFLKQTMIATLSLAALATVRSGRAIEPFRRSGSSRLLLSLAAYSFRDYFPGANPKKGSQSDAAKRMDLFQFIDFCADHGCTGTELTSYYFPGAINNEYLLNLKHHAFLRGLEISGTAVGNNFTLPKGEKRDHQIAQVKKWIDFAQIMGAPHIRVFAGSTEGASKEEAKKRAVDALDECCAYAGRKGVLLGLENHGGIVAEAEDVLEIVRAVKNPWFGLNLDTGNFNTADPYSDIAKCAPFAVNVQLKADIHPKGKKSELADLPRLVKILREANYQGYVALEYESAEDPWTAVPRLLKQMKALFES